jgi:hypothetical protein
VGEHLCEFARTIESREIADHRQQLGNCGFPPRNTFEQARRLAQARVSIDVVISLHCYSSAGFGHLGLMLGTPLVAIIKVVCDSVEARKPVG